MCAGSKRLPKVTSPRHCRWVEAARADQRAFVRSDDVDPREAAMPHAPMRKCHLRWHGEPARPPESPLRAVENAELLLNDICSQNEPPNFPTWRQRDHVDAVEDIEKTTRGFPVRGPPQKTHIRNRISPTCRAEGGESLCVARALRENAIHSTRTRLSVSVSPATQSALRRARYTIPYM